MTSQGNIYIVQINGQKRKVIDLETLLIFIEQKKHEASLLNLDPSNMEFDDSLFKHIAINAVEALNEIEDVCKEALGLNKVEEPIHDDVEPEMSEEIMPEDEGYDMEDPADEPEETPGIPEELKDIAEKTADKIIDVESDEDDDKIVL